METWIWVALVAAVVLLAWLALRSCGQSLSVSVRGGEDPIPKVIVKSGKYDMEKTMELGKDGDNDIVRDIYINVLKNNPDYSMHFFDDNSTDEFMYRHFGNCQHTNHDMQCWCSRVWLAYRTIIPSAFKADLFRFGYLYIYGGVWSDLTQNIHVSIDSLIGDKQLDSFVEDVQQGGCYYHSGVQISFMIIRKNSKLIYEFMKNAVSNILNRELGICPLDITGPVACSRVLENYDTDKYQCKMYQTKKDVIYSTTMKNPIGKALKVITCRAPTHRNCLSQDTKVGSYASQWKNNNVFAVIDDLVAYEPNPDLTFTVATLDGDGLNLEQSKVSEMREISNPEYVMINENE